jgi:hypothetical protein
VSKPCEQCPWRLANQGKKHKHSFYTKTNLRRIWGQLRRGGDQSCHLTDPSHPDHIEAGAKPGSKAKECPGSVIVVLREVAQMSENNTVTNGAVKKYLTTRKRYGLTKRGILFWVVSRIQFGGVPFIGGSKLPMVDVNDKEIGLPVEFETG